MGRSLRAGRTIRTESGQSSKRGDWKGRVWPDLADGLAKGLAERWEVGTVQHGRLVLVHLLRRRLLFGLSQARRYVLLHDRGGRSFRLLRLLLLGSRLFLRLLLFGGLLLFLALRLPDVAGVLRLLVQLGQSLFVLDLLFVSVWGGEGDVVRGG